ncbi:MAG: tripartite tricarboxylate transporter TctB family protein [Pseudomonadota bacterium]|nr:tripartite tricarboxylate transporter TctB family protein [Pseudomonadota bacterium]
MQQQPNSDSKPTGTGGAEEPRRSWGDVVLGLATLPIVAFFYAEALTFRKMDWEPLGMAFWPKVVLVGLAILGLAIAADGLRRRTDRNERFRLLAFLPWVAGLVFLAVLPWLGTYLAGLFLIVALSWFLAPEKTLRHAGIAVLNGVGSLILIHIIFAIILGLRIPSGALGF